MTTIVIFMVMFVGCTTNTTLVGEYQQVAFGLDLKYKFNDNYTYDELKTDEKGTYEKKVMAFL